ncbi:dihydrofolate reductase [Pseudoramibacter alactolyticus]|jgi:dihydrofolate reductase|uniref:dihydrofolate reductase n=1 Tax=Pseudoramibacter alactolyticus TaxID=113287 RepID=UPI00235242CE|nr:dihydrofolate reductase [Pseudoramibacter alactolyticus]MBM6967550.1 dihydrofolate reductase [Pseudoramibacter alactolyticus]
MIALIAACDRHRLIGDHGRIPWRIPGEQARFQKLTTGRVVIMGRRTYAEIGRPLPRRQTIVLSRDKTFRAPGCRTAAGLAEALRLGAAFSDQLFIAGGAAVYAEALPLADVLYLTEIDAAYAGDTYFPAFDPALFIKILEAHVPCDPSYDYYTYLRKP